MCVCVMFLFYFHKNVEKCTHSTNEGRAKVAVWYEHMYACMYVRMFENKYVNCEALV